MDGMTGLDPRRYPVRPDLAADSLRGRVTAARFAEPVPHRCRRGRTSLHAAPDAGAMKTSELLYGESFAVYDRCRRWAWGQCGTDGYVGYVRLHALRAAEPSPTPTHRVAVPWTWLTDAPALKHPPRDALGFGTLLAVAGTVNGYAALADGGWVFAGHLRPADQVDTDPVAVAERFVGVPYLWGGRSSHGVDCSGLVQMVLAACGVAAPRDSDMMAAELGTLVSQTGQDVALRRGDIVFFPGHVALMADAETVIHATAFTQSVCKEPLAAVAERADPSRGRGVTAVRRLG